MLSLKSATCNTLFLKKDLGKICRNITKVGKNIDKYELKGFKNFNCHLKEGFL